MKLLIVTLLCLTVALPVLSFRKQRYAVRGRLMCGDVPAANVRVKLVDEDDGPDPDDDMDSGYTNANGEFNLSGDERELSNIDPRLKVYHDCNDGIAPCQRKWKIKLPGSYINKNAFDVGVWNLEIGMDEEERDCIH